MLSDWYRSETNMKNVLLLVHDDPGEEARFQAMVDLSGRYRGISCASISSGCQR